MEKIDVEIEIPETPISMRVMSSKNNVLLLQVSGLKHPDITYEDFDHCGYFGKGSKDGRLDSAVDVINDVLVQWAEKINNEEEAEISSANSGISGFVSKLSKLWKEAAPPPRLDDFFYLAELDDASLDLKTGGIRSKMLPSSIPLALRDRFDISGLIADLTLAVPKIQSVALEGLKVQDMGNARSNYRTMASNALKEIGEEVPGVDLRMREAEINQSIGRPPPEGLTLVDD